MNNIREFGPNKMRKQVWIMFVLLFTFTVISNVDKAIIGFASIQFIEEFHLTPTQWGLVGSLYFLLYSFSAIIMGSRAPRLNSKNVIAFMVTVLVAVQFFTIFVYSLPLLILTRILLGAWEGPSYSTVMTSASKWLPKEKLHFWSKLILIGGPIGIATSAPILLFLIHTYGWKSGFIATTIVGGLLLLTWLKLGREKPGVVLPFQRKKKNTVHTSPQEKSDVKFSKIFFSKPFILLSLAGIATFWSYTFGLNWLPYYLANIRGISGWQLGLAVTTPWVIMTGIQLAFSIWSDRLQKEAKDITRVKLFMIGAVLMLGAISFIFGAMTSSAILAVGLLSIGLTFSSITLILGPTMLTNLSSGKHHREKILGWFMAVSSLGGLVGPYVTGLLVDKAATGADGFQNAIFIVAGLLFLFGAIVLLANLPTKKKVTRISKSAVDF